MGHDIDIGNIKTVYISFNWACYSDIFHISDIHGHSNEDRRISRKLKEALITLGVEPRDDLGVDIWGQPRPEGGMKSLPCRCMFAMILTNFLKLAEEYPDEYWYSDQVSKVKPLYGKMN